ncbi:tRNA1(Val) (adenine(37)-N6)-methyltransferase [Parapedobacter soli]|uniref:tRNA1(Val) (adenine(37)-N6)-methyltransferase n=1 Tax=Parapedobacter soli TaxID=416955 RepID=UPI0021CAAE91|nr:methyltransferase [Parapedobacter soli]
MRINTDGVLLGAMASAHSPKRILDVGTGTGVIPLMLAQRFPNVRIDAIEIDALAADTARRNFEGSPFAGRLKSWTVSLADFEPDSQYDLIVSNPPFFLRSLQNSDIRKRIARHAEIGFFDQLLVGSKRWLTPTGSLQVILPTSSVGLFGQKARGDYGLTEKEIIAIRSFPDHPPIRHILRVGVSPVSPRVDVRAFHIYERRGVYSQMYRSLLQAFFLAF